MTRYTPYQERHGRSVDSLLDQLGEHVERLPVEALPRDRPGFGSSFRDIPSAPYVDMATVDRLELIAAEGRIEMGEERWAKLNAEWSLSPEQRDQHEKEWQA
jgi:hypothetical protein